MGDIIELNVDTFTKKLDTHVDVADFFFTIFLGNLFFHNLFFSSETLKQSYVYVLIVW